jgi:Putative binding domain, N-terminal/Viral BACON domain
MKAWTVASVRVRAPRIALPFIFAFSVLTLVPSLADAQTVSPQTVEFDPSADHSRTVNGVKVVEGYELRFYAVAGVQPLHVIDMGKPSPQSDGKIRFNFSALLGAWPVNGVVYEARVVAVGPGGKTPSTVSNQFVFPATTPPPAPCTYTLSTSSRSGTSSATTGSVGVTTGAGCVWTAASDAGWLSVTSGASGSDDGSVGYAVAANSTTSQRVGHLTIAGRTFTFTQAGAACGYSLSPDTRSVGAAATSGSVTVTAGTGCAWRATSSAGWLSLSGASGNGNGTINYSVAAHTGTAVRSGTITVGSATFTVTQNGSCVYTVTPKNQSFSPPTATSTVNVTTSSSCSWTATRSGPWITITSGSSGSGNGTVRYRVSANTGSSSRTGTLTVAGQPVTLTQAAATAPNTPAGLRIINVR